MSLPYIDASTLDECKEAIRNGRKLEFLAGQLRCEPEHLANLLGLPAWRAVPTTLTDEFDLFATDKLDAQL